MPVRDWPDDDDDAGASVAQRMEQMDPTEKMRRARLLLRDLLAASRHLGDALVQAGLAPERWRDPDARLSELDRQAPDITLDALLTRLAEFAAELGPALLAGGGEALDDFERDVHALGDVLRPLRALAQRERLKPRTERDGAAIWRALSDVRVGVVLDRLTRVLRELDGLAPRLRALSAEQWQALDAALAAEEAAADAPTVAPARGPSSSALGPAGGSLGAEATVPLAYRLPDAIPDEAPGDPDAPTYLSAGWLPDARSNEPTVPVGPVPGAPWARSRTAAPLWLGQRPRKWGLLLATALALLVGTAVLTLFTRPDLLSIVPNGTPTLTSAQSTSAAGQLAREPTATVTPRPTPTITPSPAASLPAKLTASPNPLTLCPLNGPTTLTLTNTGGRATTWTASASNGATVAPRSGALQPGERAELSVSSFGATRGTITIRWSGGSLKDSFRCRG